MSDRIQKFVCGGVLVMLLCVSQAFAECTTPPSEGVDWVRCSFDNDSLNRINISKSQLRSATFFRANLEGANLSEVQAHRTKFVSANLKNAMLDGGNFMESDFTSADLEGASLKNTDLRRVRFFRANLRNADFTGAKTERADLTRADLSGAIWVNGRKCAAGSIGRCDYVPETDKPREIPVESKSIEVEKKPLAQAKS
jgi:uncharacterized protein YjbI with pentapeptide repeats